MNLPSGDPDYGPKKRGAKEPVFVALPILLIYYQYKLKNMVQFNALAPLFSRVVMTI